MLCPKLMQAKPKIIFTSYIVTKLLVTITRVETQQFMLVYVTLEFKLSIIFYKIMWINRIPVKL